MTDVGKINIVRIVYPIQTIGGALRVFVLTAGKITSLTGGEGMKTQTLEYGEPFDIPNDEPFFFLTCCDCESTHKVEIKRKRNAIEFRFYTDARQTAQKRRRKKEKR